MFSLSALMASYARNIPNHLAECFVLAEEHTLIEKQPLTNKVPNERIGCDAGGKTGCLWGEP